MLPFYLPDLLEQFDCLSDDGTEYFDCPEFQVCVDTDSKVSGILSMCTVLVFHDPVVMYVPGVVLWEPVICSIVLPLCQRCLRLYQNQRNQMAVQQNHGCPFLVPTQRAQSLKRNVRAETAVAVLGVFDGVPLLYGDFCSRCARVEKRLFERSSKPLLSGKMKRPYDIQHANCIK